MLTADALSYGPEAAALGLTQGTVLAVLRQAVYLESQEGLIVGLVGTEAPDGPLSARVADFPALHHELARLEGAPFETQGETINIAGRVGINLAAGRRWMPELPSRVGPVAAQQEAAAILRALLIASGPPSGAARLAQHFPSLFFGEPEPPLQRRIAVQDNLSRWIATALRHIWNARAVWDWAAAGAALTDLLGCGPGLTPSGDDVAMGLLAMLVWQAPVFYAEHQIRGIVQAVQEAASRRTTRISGRLLAHAAMGVLYAPAMDLGAALLAGEPGAVAAPARQLFTVGSTSGADLAVGLLAGILIGAAWGADPL